MYFFSWIFKCLLIFFLYRCHFHTSSQSSEIDLHFCLQLWWTVFPCECTGVPLCSFIVPFLDTFVYFCLICVSYKLYGYFYLIKTEISLYVKFNSIWIISLKLKLVLFSCHFSYLLLNYYSPAMLFISMADEYTGIFPPFAWKIIM